MPAFAIQFAVSQESLGPFYLAVSGTLIAICIAWIFRVRSLIRLRANIRRIYGLSEEMLAARSPEEMQAILAATLPDVLGFREVLIWEAGHAGRTLESTSPGAGSPSDNALRCYRSVAAVRQRTARRELWLPMLANGRAAGVLELRKGRKRLNVEEEAALQHLANQIAIALQLIGQNALREQVLRNERLGAVGQLIAGVAADLHAPVSRLAAELSRLNQTDGNATGTTSHLLHLAEDASRTVSRLVAIGTAVQGPAQPVDVLELLKTLTEFRAQSWRLQGIEVQFEPPQGPIVAMASPGQLEQALLSLLIHAERTLSQQTRKHMSLAVARLAGQAVIELTVPDGAVRESPSLNVVQEIIRNQEGTLRIVQQDQDVRYTISLPVSAAPKAIREDPGITVAGPMTILLVEHDSAARRALLELLSVDGHRVVPAETGAEAVELAGRMAFDAIFATPVLRDRKWLALYEQVRRLAPAFVLLHDANAAAPAVMRDVLLLAKPVEPRELARLLGQVAQRMAAAHPGE